MCDAGTVEAANGMERYRERAGRDRMEKAAKGQLERKCQDLTSITQSELMRQVNDNSKNGECISYRPATHTTIHAVTSLCT